MNMSADDTVYVTEMADFDAIYEIEEEVVEEFLTITVPDPIVIRGAGNITV